MGAGIVLGDRKLVRNWDGLFLESVDICDRVNQRDKNVDAGVKVLRYLPNLFLFSIIRTPHFVGDGL